MAEQATHGFTRRSFIKGAAALTATGALVGCSPQTQNLEKAEGPRRPALARWRRLAYATYASPSPSRQFGTPGSFSLTYYANLRHAKIGSALYG